MTLIYKNHFNIKVKEMENYPENHRMRWTNKENIELLKEINKGINLETIASNHKRTIGAIKYRLIRYAIELAETDQTLSLLDLSTTTTLSCKDLIEGFKKLKYEYDYIDMSGYDSNGDYESESEVDDENDENEDNEMNNDNNYDEINDEIEKINRKINIIAGIIGIYAIAKIIKLYY